MTTAGPPPVDAVGGGGTTDPRRPRHRRRASAWKAVVPVAALAAGLLFGTSANISRGEDLRARDTTELADAVANLDRTVQRRTSLAVQLRAEVDALAARAAPGDAEVRRLNDQVDRAAQAAGTEPVTGPAVTVVLDDAHRTAASLPEGFTPDDIVVHQQDVQSVVNALWRAGAEAMTLQDQRVISTSAVRCVGNTLILQGRVYSPPYTIRAIGDPAALRDSLDRDPQVTIYRQYVDVLGLGYTVTSEAKVTFPAYTGTLQLSHATAAP